MFETEKAPFALTMKQTPILLVIRMIVLSTFFNLAYLTVAALSDYYAEFNQVVVFNGMALDTVIIFTLMALHLLIVAYLFLRWFTESYTVSGTTIIHRWGIIVVRERRYTLENVESITFVKNILGRIFHYGTINIRYPSDQMMTQLSAIPYPEQFVALIEHDLMDRRK